MKKIFDITLNKVRMKNSFKSGVFLYSQIKIEKIKKKNFILYYNILIFILFFLF
jgi:hypothetical protein